MNTLLIRHCENCGIEHDGTYGSGRFCSKECARSFSSKLNTNIRNEKISKTLKNKHIRETICKKCGTIVYTKGSSPNVCCDKCRQKRKSNTPYCNRCGAERGKCKYPSLCKKKLKLFDGLEKYFGFDKTSFGSKRYYEEIFRIKAMIEEDYYENNNSTVELCKKYNHTACGSFIRILKSIDIVLRNLKESSLLAYKTGRSVISIDNSTQYKHGWHTAWDNTQIFYRSSYELDYAEKLDEQKVKYDVEALRISYFDTQKCIERTAIPDFYLPETNTIVEIKSSWTYNEQNMNDKIKAYKKHGYNFKLILDHKEVV